MMLHALVCQSPYSMSCTTSILCANGETSIFLKDVHTGILWCSYVSVGSSKSWGSSAWKLQLSLALSERMLMKCLTEAAAAIHRMKQTMVGKYAAMYSVCNGQFHFSKWLLFPRMRSNSSIYGVNVSEPNRIIHMPWGTDQVNHACPRPCCLQNDHNYSWEAYRI